MNELEEEGGIFQSPDFPPTVTSFAAAREHKKKMITTRDEKEAIYAQTEYLRIVTSGKEK